MTDEELMDIARPLAADGGRWPSDWLTAMRAAIAAEHAACVKACEAAEDTGNDSGIERDVAMWNKAVAYCVRRLKERSNDLGNRLAATGHREGEGD